jgi:NADP-dependent 3-hydroxy acid dehydrogenase YdfG
MLLEIAKEFVAHGAKAVVLMARNKEKLEAVTKEVGAKCHWE